MRRTYKSKKESGGAFDHRDVLHNMDEKSSAFDAFYIQNIKQTKRELSSVGSSIHFGVASSRVRKRKYVKRILKEAEPAPQRETMSPSAYLTPDKSIRVNKVLDPFDMLLNSSPVCQEGPKVVTSAVKKEKVPKKECKKYTRKRLPKMKNKYSSSDSNSTESDKENSNDTESNVTDIRAHELIIERVPSQSPKYLDESINKIVNNISLINNLKQKTSKSSFNTSYKLNNSRISKFHSPIVPKSPLCSTPYREKYRGMSIYKFSPISTKELDNSPTIIDEIDESNKSVILPCNTSKKALQKSTPLKNIPSLSIEQYKSLAEETTKADNTSIVENNIKEQVYLEEENGVEIEDNNVEIEQNDFEIEAQNIETETNHDSISNTELNTFQITDAEPFLGFSNVEKEHSSEKILLKCLENELEKDDVHNDESREIEMEDDKENYSEANSFISDKHDFSQSDQSSVISENSDKESSYYDTCSDHSLDFKEQVPVVTIERMNDSLFLKYYEKMIEAQIESEIENDYESLADDLEINEAQTDNKTNVITITDSSTTDDVTSNGTDDEEEEQFVSFVNTRRRNNLTADSRFSFDTSFVSSSTDCDKTVLSNKVNMEKSHLVDNLDSIEENENNASPSSVRTSISSMFSIEQNCNEISPSSDRFSLKTFRESTQTSTSGLINPQLDASTNDATLMEDIEASNVTVVENSLELSSICLNAVPKPDNRDSLMLSETSYAGTEAKPNIVLQPGKKWERSLSIYRRMTTMSDLEQSILEDECSGKKGRKYRQSVISTMEMQEHRDSLYNDSIFSRKSTFLSKPGRPTIRFVKDSNYSSRLTLNASSVVEDLKGFLSEECDDTVIELSKLSIADPEHEVSILDKFHESERVLTARDYVLRRCNQTEPLLFDECYPELALKNCHKIGEGVYGEVFLWRARDGRARVMKIVPIAGSVKVNGEDQKDFHEIISEIVIAMELSALRAPIADIERQLDEGNDVQATQLHAIQNATDIFNEVLAVRCVFGPYPSRLLDLWELYDECKGSENDSPALLPASQRYIVLELANAGQDLESYQFANAQQAHALFQQLAFGLAVAEEAFQFEHRDLHWGNVLIAPTEQKEATFVLRGRTYRTPRRGVAATIIDYSLSRVTVPLSAEHASTLYNDLARDEQLFDAVGDYQFQVYRLMREKLGNDWKNFEPYTNILWLHYTVDKMITALRYKRTNTKIHKHYIEKLSGIKDRILEYGSAVQYVLTDIEI